MTGDFTVNAFRGYFQLKQGLTANPNQTSVRAFRLRFDEDGETTGIVSAEANSSLSEWYTLDGRKLSGRPTGRGIYVRSGRLQGKNNGRKIIIK